MKARPVMPPLAALLTLLVDADGRVRDCDAAAPEGLGWPRETLCGMALTDLIPSAQLPADEAARFAAVVLTAHSRHMHAEVTVSAPFDGRRSVMVRETLVALDDSHREFGGRFSDLLRRQPDPGAVVAAAVQAIGEQLGVSRAMFSRIDLARDTATVLAMWTDGSVPRFAGEHPLQATLGERVVAGYRRGETLVNDDALSDARLVGVDMERMRALGVCGVCTVPLLVDGELSSVLSVHTREPRAWTAADVRLIEDAAERLVEARERAEAEARLRESDELFRGMAENLPSLCWVSGPDSRILWANRRWHEFNVLNPKLFEGDPTGAIHPDDLRDTQALRARANEDRAPVKTVVRCRGPDGAYRPMLTQAAAIRDANGRVLRWCGVQTDLSEQYEREARQGFLLELGEALRRESDPVAILRTASERLGRHLQVDRVVYGEIDAASGVIVSPCDWAAPDLDSMAGRRLAPTEDNWVIVGYREGRTLACPDHRELEGTSENFRDLHRAIGATAFITAPLVKEGRLHGLFSVYDRRRRVWSADEVGLVEEVGERTWEALWRARAEAGSRASEEQFRTFAESLPDIAFVVDALGAPLWWNGRHEALLGPGQGMAHVARMCHPDDAPAVMAAWAAAMAAGEPIRAECRLLCVDGVYRLFNAYATPVKDPDGAVIRWCGLCRDVTDARAQERSQRFLFELGEALRDETDPVAILRETCARLGDFMHADRVGYGVFDDAIGEVTVETDWAGPGRAAVTGLRHRLSDNSITVDAYRSGRTQAFRDVVAMDGVSEGFRQMYRRLDARASISVPLVREGRLLAIFGVYQAEPRDWSDEEVQLAKDVGERSWAALERARAEAGRRETEALLNAILTNAPVGMYVKDVESRYVLMNAEMGRMLGAPAESFIGRTATETLDADLAAEVAGFDRQVLASGQAVVNERRMRADADGPYAWTLSTRFPVQTRPGAPLQVAGINVDLSAQKRAEAQLERSREALYQSEKLTALGSLLAGVSHELNNPLSIVVAQAVMMERQAEGGPLAERARQIRGAADRCARIVQTFLAMARQRPPERRRVDLNAVLDAALELTAYGLRTSGVTLLRDQASTLPAISADADQLHQVLINLVINAQQALQEKPGVRTLTARTRAAADGASVVLEIADDGPGVSSDLRRRIFEPFFTTKPQEVGTGVGLSFSLGLVEAHGGRLELLETPGGGATFRVVLPISAASDPIIAPPVVLADADLTLRSALVIDDEPQIARALAEFLEFEGYRCDVVFGGGDAKARLLSADYDLILSDLRMPDVDGPALFGWIKAEKPDLARRVAFSTGDTLGAPVVRFLAREGRPFMEKPFTPATLRALLDEIEADRPD